MTTTPKPERLKQIIALWNDTAMSQTGIGKVVGLPRGSVGRILSEARRSGMTVTGRCAKLPQCWIGASSIRVEWSGPPAQ